MGTSEPWTESDFRMAKLSPSPALSHSRFDEKAAIERVMALMAIRGKSCHERAVVQHITDELLRAGVPASAIFIDQVNKKSPAGGEVGNLIVSLPGTVRG